MIRKSGTRFSEKIMRQQCPAPACAFGGSGTLDF
jgi:hypothetical protein